MCTAYNDIQELFTTLHNEIPIEYHCTQVSDPMKMTR